MKKKKMFLAFLLVVSVALVRASQNCAFDPDEERLRCSLRTLNKHNSSIESAHRAKHVIMQCSDVFFYESVLRTNHFGYLPSLKSLDLEYCKIRRIPSLAFSGLSGLLHLDVRTHNSEWPAMVMELEEDAFTGLNELQTLNFTHNNLWTVPQAAFCVLRSLTTLNLSTNYLQDVSDLGFSSQGINSCRLRLHTLDLSHNSLTSIPPTSFGQLQRLRTLNLEGNNLNVLDDRALGNLHSLEKVNLANNELVAIPPNLFEETPKLTELYLQNNSLSVLAPGIFESLDQLLVLNLSRNDISSDWLNSDTFSAQARLVALDLSYNRLTTFDQSILRSAPSLQLLDLKHNQIHSLSANTFVLQPQLHILLLSHNRLETLHPLAGLPALKSLSLDHNNLRSLSRDALRNCSSLQDLALNNNLLDRIPEAIRPLTLLRTLDIGENRISNVKNDSFEGLRNLYGLRMSGNGIRELPKDLFRSVSAVQVLNLAHNQIAKLDKEIFNSLINLRMLRLDNNRLEDINGLLTAQSELKWLNISSNQLLWFDYAFLPKSLQWLDLHENQIQELGNYYKLHDGFNLKTIDASRNQIKKLDEISLLQSLEYVFLSENEISTVAPGTFQNKPNLVQVELTKNKLRSLQLSAIAVSSRGNKDPLPEFFLGDNPFYCDCEMEWLKTINQMSHQHPYPRVMDLDRVECQLMRNRTAAIMHVPSSEFLCEYQQHCFAVCNCCDFFACDCRMQCPLGCSCFHDSTWTTNVIQCSGRGHSEIPPLVPMDATAVFLDGNNFTGTLISQAFIGRKRVNSLFLNGSLIEAVSNQTFNGLTELETLHLEDNRIRKLSGYEFSNLTSLRELYLHNNRLVFIHDQAFASLVSLELLHLHGNLLASFSLWSIPSAMSTGITLAGNPWTCECEFVTKFVDFTRRHRVLDLDRVQCVSENEIRTGMKFRENVTCTDALAVSYGEAPSSIDVIPIAVAILAVCIILAMTSIIVFVFRTPLRVWLHSKYGIRVASGKVPKGKIYDAFMSYSVKDADFVHQQLAPQLEHDDPGYKLLLQHRDMPNTSSIADTFPTVSQLCAKQILVVTRAYLEADWLQLKYVLQDFKNWRPIVILLEELSSLDLAAAPEFNLLLKTATVIRWSDAGFWNKLRFFLPDSLMQTYSRNLSTAQRTQHPKQSAPPFPPIPSNNSSTSTRSTDVGGASPRTEAPKVVANPLDQVSGGDPWSSDQSDSVYSWLDHTYQTVGGQPPDPLYHTLEPDTFQSVGSVDVMLPNGQMVPATLVRNAAGRVVPVVPVSRTLPRQEMFRRAAQDSPDLYQQQQPMQSYQQPPPPRLAEPPVEVTFPRTVVYRPQTNPRGGYLV